VSSAPCAIAGVAASKAPIIAHRFMPAPFCPFRRRSFQIAAPAATAITTDVPRSGS
jgi:hypothetical protein